MDATHHLLFLCGALGLLSIAAGFLFARVGTPILLAFVGLGMLAGKDGIGGIALEDYGTAYLVGSAALAVILFEGGLKIRRDTWRQALGPAAALATVGVLITAGIVALAFTWLLSPPWPFPVWTMGLLIGATVAPTDAAAVSLLLRRAGLALPPRLTAVLEMESGLNDPVSVFLTVALTEYLVAPQGVTAGGLAWMLARELCGGAAFGLAGGWALTRGLRLAGNEATVRPVLAAAGALSLFGAAQSLGASGFLAVYLAGTVVGTDPHPARIEVGWFFEALGWAAEIVLFLTVGLLVSPSVFLLKHLAVPAVALVLMLVARPAACLACPLPFGFGLRDTALASWVGLRGAMPVFLLLIPLLAGVPGAATMISPNMLFVILTLAVQGWTVAPLARLLGPAGPWAAPHAASSLSSIPTA